MCCSSVRAQTACAKGKQVDTTGHSGTAEGLRQVEEKKRQQKWVHLCQDGLVMLHRLGWTSWKANRDTLYHARVHFVCGMR